MTRIALITGGNRGLGRSAALALAARDTDVVLTYRSHRDEAEAVVAEIEALGRRAVALPLDTSDAASLPALVESLRGVLSETWGRATLDILINNAGFDGLTPLGAVDPEVLDGLYRVHVRGPILLTDLVQAMVADGGRILFVSTGLTRFVADPRYSVYASMKGAMEAYTRYTAKALGARRITVNAIAPGATATDFAGGAIRDSEDYQALITANHASGRVGEPEDIGAAVAAVVSEEAHWITGQRIEASGGQAL